MKGYRLTYYYVRFGRQGQRDAPKVDSVPMPRRSGQQSFRSGVAKPGTFIGLPDLRTNLRNCGCELVCSGFIRLLTTGRHRIQNLLRDRVTPLRRNKRAGHAGRRVFIYKLAACQAYARHTLGIIHIVFLS